MRKANIGVVGLGSVGSFALKELAESGEEVIGFEAFGVGNDLSGVGGETRLFRRLYREGRAYHRFVERSYELWKDLNEHVPNAFTECGALTIVPKGSLYAFDLEDYGKEFEVPYSRLTSEELAQQYPQFPQTEGDVGYFDPCGGFIRTDLVVRHAVERALDAGATVVEQAVTQVEAREEGVLVTCGEDEWLFEKVVISAGARSAQVFPSLADVVNTHLLLMTWFQTKDILAPLQFHPKKFPVFIREGNSFHAYGAPSLDGVHVKVSGLVEHRTNAIFDGLLYDNLVHLEDIELCAEKIPTVLDVHPIPVRTAIYPDLFSLDGDFILDWADTYQRVFVASALSGKGFKMCNSLGEHVAQVIRGAEDTISEFSLKRFAATTNLDSASL